MLVKIKHPLTCKELSVTFLMCRATSRLQRV